jgi:hypothetical protein
MSNRSHSIPPVISKMYAVRPIMMGEDPQLYDSLLTEVVDQVRPQKLQEFLLAKDIADAEWELLRLTAMKANMVNASIASALGRASQNGLAEGQDETMYGRENATLRKHAEMWHQLQDLLAGDPEAEARLKNLLRLDHIALDAMAATAFEKTILAQLHTDRMVTAALCRRTAAYVEINRLRAAEKDKGNGDKAWKDLEHLDEPSVTVAYNPKKQLGRQRDSAPNGQR